MYRKPIDAVTINDKEYKIDTDFRFWAEFFETVNKDSEKAGAMLTKYIMINRLPLCEASFKVLLQDFFGKAFEINATSGGTSKKSKKVVDFIKDAPLISAAFLTQYNIDLERDSLHWWDFIRLFWGLTEEHNISKIMSYRGADTSKMSKEQAKVYKELQETYRLDGTKTNGRRDLMGHVEKFKKRREEELSRQRTVQ